MDSLQKKEYWLYASAWTLVFALVPLVLFIQQMTGHNPEIAWKDILPIWSSFLPYLLLFVLHDILAAPLFQDRRWGWYVAVTLPLLVAFGLYCLSAPAGPPEWGPPPDGPRMPPPDARRPMDPRYMKLIIGLLIVLVNLGVKALAGMARRERQILANGALQPAPEAREPEFVSFRTAHKTVSVPLKDIRYIESMSEYVKVHLDSQEHPLVVLYSLKRLIGQLPPQQFMRIHRSYIIPLERVREATPASVTLDGGTTLPVGESYRATWRAARKGDNLSQP